jgi:hypothetical protein
MSLSPRIVGASLIEGLKPAPVKKVCRRIDINAVESRFAAKTLIKKRLFRISFCFFLWLNKPREQKKERKFRQAGF